MGLGWVWFFGDELVGKRVLDMFVIDRIFLFVESSKFGVLLLKFLICGELFEDFFMCCW